ncbi:hypothetical protein M427DRAFT_428653 [Gonapodya prolifera JEL478]|uniref:Uncharacterized protein n=1 Tax=Gonapodya prolifera (strain JEL478) TaxID=1344416 RepID=A0A139ASM1_GONPJ|nr:hypothetical protein M427DRAFT_428653 [Gonapodya prolifera JEL478]|eukprot:KXS19740.1 hypothetical protein M427DRAFT_428653 [Gonapodya prolifera JEL478]
MSAEMEFLRKVEKLSVQVTERDQTIGRLRSRLRSKDEYIRQLESIVLELRNGSMDTAQKLSAEIELSEVREKENHDVREEEKHGYKEIGPDGSDIVQTSKSGGRQLNGLTAETPMGSTILTPVVHVSAADIENLKVRFAQLEAENITLRSELENNSRSAVPIDSAEGGSSDFSVASSAFDLQSLDDAKARIAELEHQLSKERAAKTEESSKAHHRIASLEAE